MFNNSVPTAKKTHNVPGIRIKWLMLFKEIIPVYTENHTRPTNEEWSVINIKTF